MFYKVTVLFIFLTASTYLDFAQQRQERKGGTISGKVSDLNEKAPIEYANIILLSQKDSTQVTGTVTNKEGKFSLTGIVHGNYFLNVQFIGYEKKVLKNISFAGSNIDLGNIYIKPSAINLQNVVVQGERSPVTYRIDKKVIDVNQMQTAISGNVADVLENIPSISVDIDGTVSLRGSSNFTVLIDGRPSVMDAQDALQQIPASSIENIEIITNPSAKYDPEGNAGIINIIMKKNKNFGLSGIANLNAGANDKFGGDFLFEHKTSLLTYNFGLDYNRRFFPGTSREEQQFDYLNNVSIVNSNGTRERGRISFGLRGGIDFNLGQSDRLSFGGRFGTREQNNNSFLNYSEWSILEPQNFLYLSRNKSSRSGNFYAINSNYTHKFSTSGHELSGEFFLSHHTSDESTLSAEIQEQQQFGGKKTIENGPETGFRGKIDYVLPLGEKRKFEAGSKGEIEISQTVNELYQFSTQSNVYEFQPDFSNNVNSKISELAAYSMYSDIWGNFGFQGGLRTEYTYRTIKLEEKNQDFSIDRWDLFPAAHTSYKFSEETQAMLSYTRRIDRPSDWNLEPFYTWTDANNIRRGNPDLKPEFIDSYDLSFQTFWVGVSFSNDFYYRVNHNKIERVNSVYSENVTLTTFDNVGTDYSLGSEFMATYDPLKIWNVSLTGNVYNYKIEGILYNEPFSRESFNWSMRISNGLKVTGSTMLQLNVRYNSPTVSSQGRWEGFFMTDFALKQDLLEKKLSLTLQVRDLFKTAKHEFSSQGPDFRTSSYFTREAPIVMLNLRFNFNNYKKEDMPGNEQPDNDVSGEDI